jgi:FkbM family methyltransferase
MKQAYRRASVRRTPAITTPLSPAPKALSAVIAYNEHGGYVIPTASIGRPAAQAVMAGGVWERATIDFMIRHAARGDVVHAGTYFGDFLPALSAGLAPGAKVWAFEPVLESYHCAAMTVLLNDLTNVELRGAALGADNTPLTMVVRDASGRSLGGTSRVTSETLAPGRGETVAQVALDDAVPGDRVVSVLQLDVEKFERQALAGALRLIRRWRPVLILENTPEPQWFEEHIASLGYEFRDMVDVNSVFSVRGKC